MSQGDVVKILNKTRRWMTSKEITKRLKIGHKNVINNLKKVWDTTDELERKLVKHKNNCGLNYIWEIKKRR